MIRVLIAEDQAMLLSALDATKRVDAARIAQNKGWL